MTSKGRFTIHVIWIPVVLLTDVAAFAASAQADNSRATQKLCATVYRDANRVSNGSTISFNRQASVREVACNGFGGDTHFHIDGGIVCALTAAAIGPGFDKLSLFVDSSCNSAQLAASHDVGTAAGAACGMLSDLLNAFKPAKAYAIAAGVSCAFGKPLGDWIESHSERVAAEGVMRSGKCLRFTTHSFPLTDDWSAVACRPGDRGFSSLPLARSPSAPQAPIPAPAPPPATLPLTRATMAWDTDSDIDLYTWDASGNLLYYGEREGIPNTELVEDVIPVEGEFSHVPEVFRETADLNRPYTFGICDFRGEGADVTLTVTDPGGGTRSYFHTLDYEGDSAVITSSPQGFDYSPPFDDWCHYLEEF
jgi:hypothetical protein